MSFQTDAPLPVIQSHLIIISAVAIILFMLIMFWVLYTQSIRRIKIMRKTLQQKALDLEQTKEKYRQLVEQITAVTYIDEADQHNSTIFISPQIAALSGYSAEEWKTNPKLWSNIIHPEDRNRAKKEFLLSDENNQPYKIDYRIITKGGKTVWIHDEAVRTEIEGKMVLHGVMYDITERKQLEESLRYISTHDVLTGLYNRTFFDEELNRLQKGRKFPVSVIIADIDDLKTINDKYGHPFTGNG
jgi:PAS domain S-box-containing protein